MEFLDSVLESTRAKEAALKKETQEQLEVFRKQQENADRVQLLDDDAERRAKSALPEASEEQWKTTGRKRRRVAEKEGLKGVKLRKSSSTSETPALEQKPHDRDRALEGERQQKAPETEVDQAKNPTAEAVEAGVDRATVSTSASHQSSAKGLLSLDYGSDEDG